MPGAVFARLFDVLANVAEDRGLGKLRAKLTAPVAGVVVEVGAGTGMNFKHYGDAVTEIVAVEPDRFLREKAAARADERVRLLDGTAESLPLGDGVADAVVFCLVLCSVSDQGQALQEARRVLKPGGRLHVLEHVVSPESPTMRGIQRGLDATVWPRLFGGCHCARDTTAAIEAAGFLWDDLQQRRYPDLPGVPVAPHLYAVATSPVVTSA